MRISPNPPPRNHHLSGGASAPGPNPKHEPGGPRALHRRPLGLIGTCFACLLATPGLAAAADVLGRISTTRPATLTSDGVAVRLNPGQWYPVLSGDRVESGHVDGETLVGVPAVGSVRLGASTDLRLERVAARYQVQVDRGQIGLQVAPGVPLTLTSAACSGDLGAADLAPTTVRGSLTVAEGPGCAGEGAATAYLVQVDGANAMQVTDLCSGALLFAGEASAEAALEALPRDPDCSALANGAAGGAASADAEDEDDDAGWVPVIGATVASAVFTALVAWDDGNGTSRPPRGVPPPPFRDRPPASPVLPGPPPVSQIPPVFPIPPGPRP